MKVGIQAHRFSGAGNTFFIIEGATVESSLRKRLVTELCETDFTFKTDGALFLDLSTQATVKWDFYNRDGSPAEMCGNAARCVALYLKKQRNHMQVTIETGGDVVQVDSIGNEFSVLMPKIKELKNDAAGFFINSGVPHWVLESDPNSESTAKLRPLPPPHGSNVTFLKNENSTWNAISFERGVEGYTKSCGTGAVAAASYLHEKRGLPHAAIKMPGGVLEVNFAGERPTLKGGAQFQFSFEKALV